MIITRTMLKPGGQILGGPDEPDPRVTAHPATRDIAIEMQQYPYSRRSGCPVPRSSLRPLNPKRSRNELGDVGKRSVLTREAIFSTALLPQARATREPPTWGPFLRWLEVS